jgi:hypothetical protein
MQSAAGFSCPGGRCSFRSGDVMRAIEARARQVHAETMRIIEDDLIAKIKIDREPDALDIALAKETAAVAARVRWDDAFNCITQGTWEAEEVLIEALCALRLTHRMTIAAASLKHAARGRG